MQKSTKLTALQKAEIAIKKLKVRMKKAETKVKEESERTRKASKKIAKQQETTMLNKRTSVKIEAKHKKYYSS